MGTFAGTLKNKKAANPMGMRLSRVSLAERVTPLCVFCIGLGKSKNVFQTSATAGFPSLFGIWRHLSTSSIILLRDMGRDIGQII